MHSFGHAAYFGLGAYGAAILLKATGAPMLAVLVAAPLVAAAGAVVVGWFSVRLSGVYQPGAVVVGWFSVRLSGVYLAML